MSSELSNRVIGEEARKSHESRRDSGFIDRYLSGAHILDIGYKGYVPDVVPIVPQAIGVELDYPGYDGRTLPFPDSSQDAVFASHCLEHIPDFRNALRDWFRVLRIGGFIVVMVPHHYLYEKRIAMPSRWNGDHKRFYTPATLMTDVESTLEPNTYRLRHLVDNDEGFDYTLDPGRHSGGAYEIELVIEKIAPPTWPLDGFSPAADDPPPDVTPFETVVAERHAQAQRITVIPSDGRDLAIYDFSDGAASKRRILVLKLDHFGDFIIGIPAMQELRGAFPDAHIRLVCGSWNVAAARDSDLFDEVCAYNFFPENPLGWDRTPPQQVDVLRDAARGHWEIAIDLRVDDDTRSLLEHIDADVRCGVGTRGRMPFLDVALPPEHEDRQSPLSERSPTIVLRPDMLTSRMPIRSAFFQATSFAESNTHLVYGPYMQLPRGQLRATFGLTVDRGLLDLGRLIITLDVCRDQRDVVATRTFKARELVGQDIKQIGLEFDNMIEDSRYEFRIHARRRPLRAKLRFFGVQIEHLETAPAPRYRRAELHIGEQLSLLVRLVSERDRALYDAADEPVPSDSTAPNLATGSASVRTIVIAPVSNSDLRNWPMESYAALVSLLLARLDCQIVLTGSRTQTGELATIARLSGGSDRVVNLAGRTSWTDLPAILRQADLVICNNSGVAHLSASLGVRTLSIYSASHQPQEWGPRGRRSRAVMAIVACSPCGHDQLSECPNDHACMRGITAQAVADLAAQFLDEEVGASAGNLAVTAPA